MVDRGKDITFDFRILRWNHQSTTKAKKAICPISSGVCKGDSVGVVAQCRLDNLIYQVKCSDFLGILLKCNETEYVVIKIFIEHRYKV